MKTNTVDSCKQGNLQYCSYSNIWMVLWKWPGFLFLGRCKVLPSLYSQGQFSVKHVPMYIHLVRCQFRKGISCWSLYMLALSCEKLTSSLTLYCTLSLGFSTSAFQSSNIGMPVITELGSSCAAELTGSFAPVTRAKSVSKTKRKYITKCVIVKGEATASSYQDNTKAH